MLTLRNKFIFAPIKLGYSDASGIVKQKHIDFYVRRSKYIAAVTPEPFFLDECLKEVPTQMGIHDDKMIEGLKRLNLAIHNEGAKTIAHLNHPGRMANPKIPGNYFWSSTNKACENGGAVPEKMDRKKINTVIRLFVNAARRAVASNFDMIELQFGHGYLLAQFLSPAVNDRKDDYGGSFENRIRFPLELARAVRREVDVPIIARISGDEMIEKGFHLDEMIRFSLMLQNTGLDGIHVSAGSVCSTPPWFFQHMFIPKGKTWEMAEAIKKHLNIPVIFVGRINSPEDVHELDKKYHADYLAVGRALVADPDFIGKYLGKLEGNIRPCLACADGCLGGVKSGVGLQCLVNPDVGKDHVDIEKVKEPQKYAVVGGGLAGMEAALILKKRGHEVDLYEKEKLGGQFNLAPLTPGKKSMGVLVPYFVKELEDNKVHVIYKEARDSDLKHDYDGVILASGSKPAALKIPGLSDYHWAEILLEKNLPENKKILIIGGGLVGVDIATALIPRNNKLIIVKRTTDFGEDMELIAKNLSLKMMREKETLFSDHTFITKVEGNTVYARKDEQDIQFQDVDMIVVSAGMKSYVPFEKLGDTPVYIVGDARKVGKAKDAIHEAHDLAMKL